jgi:predicted DNA-binding transcriptional regulator AlpA
MGDLWTRTFQMEVLVPRKNFTKRLLAGAAALDFADYPDRLLTPAEASEVTGVAVQTLSNWRASGRGPRYVKFGRRTVRYPRDALEEFAAIEMIERSPEGELDDIAIIREIARLANRLARRRRNCGHDEIGRSP